MKRLISFIATTFLTISCAIARSDDFKVDFAIERETYLLGEPIFVDATLTNISGTKKSLLFCDAMYGTTIRLIIEDDKGNAVRNAYPILDFKRGYKAITKVVGKDERISTSIPVIDVYMLAKAGKYTIYALYECDGQAGTWKGSVRSAKKTITIREPKSEDDKKILQILKRSGTTFTYDEQTCQEILKVSTMSIYSKYARYYLASSYQRRMEKNGYYKDFFDEAVKLYKETTAEKSSFSESAQFSIAECYLIKGDKKTAIEEARKVINDYPKGTLSEEAKKLIKKIEGTEKDIDTHPKKNESR